MDFLGTAMIIAMVIILSIGKSNKFYLDSAKTLIIITREFVF
ncbi:MAG: hypothetical protein ACLTK8_02390 [Paeniclostridium sp.]